MRQLEYSSRPFIASLARLVYERTRAHCYLVASPLLPFLAALCGIVAGPPFHRPGDGRAPAAVGRPAGNEPLHDATDRCGRIERSPSVA